MILHSTYVFSDQNYFSNATTSCVNDSDGASRLYFSGEFKKRFLNLKMFYTVNGKPPEARSFGGAALKTTFEVCNVQKGMIGNFLINALVENIHHYSNYSFECPQPAGFYHLTGFPVEIISKYIPHSFLKFIVGNNTFWEAIFVVKGKISKAKPLVNVFTLKTYGSFNEKP